MTTAIEFTETMLIGEKQIDAINVVPINFVSFVTVWNRANQLSSPNVKYLSILQRLRMKHQTHFMSGGTRLIPDDAFINTLPLTVAKPILRALYIGEGRQGEIISEGDGINKAILYKLGTPIPSGKEGKMVTELEFKADTYGPVEDVLAEQYEIPQALEMLRKVAKPVEVATLTTLPGWMLDAITPADGVAIATAVVPLFTE